MFTHNLNAHRAAEHQQQMRYEAAVESQVHQMRQEQAAHPAPSMELRTRWTPLRTSLAAMGRQAAKMALWF